MDTLSFASSMENGIAANIRSLMDGCSPELSVVLEQLILYQQEFAKLIEEIQAKQSGMLLPEINPVRYLGDEAAWDSLAIRFNPASSPSAKDYAVLWSVHAMLEKASQFYQQAAQNTEQAQLRLSLRSIAEMKTMLRRRIDGVERIVANQVWKTVGFPPGLLAKE